MDLRNLKTENFQLKKNFEDLKQAYGALSEVNSRLKHDNLAIKKQLTEQADQHSQLINEWRIQLEAKQADFEVMRMQMQLPADIEVLKVKFFAEFEQGIQGQAQAYDAEVNKWQKLYYGLQKDFQEFRFKVNQQDCDYQGTLEDLNLLHQSEILKLSYQLEDKDKSLQEVGQLQQRLKELQKECGQLAIKVKTYSNEVLDVRAQNSDQSSKYESRLRQATEKVQQTQQMLQQIEAEKLALKSKIEHLEETARQDLLAYQQQLSEFDKLKKQLVESQTDLESINHKNKSELGAKELSHMKDQALQSQQLKEQKTANESLKHELEQYQQQQQRHLLKISQIEQEIHDKVREAHEQEWSKYSQLEEQKVNLEKQYNKLCLDSDTDIQQKQFEVQALKLDLEKIQKELLKVQSRCQLLSHTSEKFQSENESLRKEQIDMQKRSVVLEEKVLHSQALTQQSQSSEEVLRQELTQLSSDLQSTQQQFIEAQDAHILEKKALSEHHATSLQQAQKQVQKLEFKLSQLLQERDSAQKSQQDSLAAINKLKVVYQQKLEQAQKAVEAWKMELQHSESENARLRKSLENDNYTAQLKLREMLRKQGEFLHVLQSEELVQIPLKQKVQQ